MDPSTSLFDLTPLPFGVEHSQIFRGKMPEIIKNDSAAKEKAITELKTNNIGYVVLLCSEDECKKALQGTELKQVYAANGIGVIYFPIPDFGVPKTQASMADLVDEIVSTMGTKKNIVIHCKGGKGRTGTVIGCLAKKILGLKGDEAYTWTRSHVRGAIETPAQRKFVAEFLEEEEDPAHDFVVIKPSQETQHFRATSELPTSPRRVHTQLSFTTTLPPTRTPSPSPSQTQQTRRTQSQLFLRKDPIVAQAHQAAPQPQNTQQTRRAQTQAQLPINPPPPSPPSKGFLRDNSCVVM